MCCFETYGCEQTVELGSLNAHESQCPFRLCQICEIPLSPTHDHNCVESMKTEKIDLLSKLNESNRNSKKLLDRISTLIQNLSLLSLSSKTVTIGNKMSESGQLLFQCNQYMRLSFTEHMFLGPTPQVMIDIHYDCINELLYCFESYNAFIIIRLGSDTYKKMVANLSKNGLNIKSIGISIVSNLN